MKQTEPDLRRELEERLRFETMLAEISARFVNLPTDRIDNEIEDAQRRICECLELDLSVLWQWSNERPRYMTVTQFEPSCISTRVYRGVDEARAIMIEELWTSEEDILRHLRSEEYRRILLVIEMAEEPPEIRFDTIRHSSGLEAIEKVRNQS
ncbi:antibiotic biosynthesis monooxygenase [Thermodesulfobacteriota bacterium]